MIIADELVLDAPIGVVWNAIEDPAVERDEAAIIWAVEEDSTGFGRMVSEWRSGFALTEIGDATIVTAVSTFRPTNTVVRTMLPVIPRRFRRTQRAIPAGLQDAMAADGSARAGVNRSITVACLTVAKAWRPQGRIPPCARRQREDVRKRGALAVGEDARG